MFHSESGAGGMGEMVWDGIMLCVAGRQDELGGQAGYRYTGFSYQLQNSNKITAARATRPRPPCWVRIEGMGSSERRHGLWLDYGSD